MRPLQACAKAAALVAFLLTRVLQAADPVVVWDRVLNDVLPNSYRPEPAGAVALLDGSLVLSFYQRGCIRVFPGGRVDVLGGCEPAPDQWEWGVRMDGEQRVFLGGGLTRVDPGTGLALFRAPGNRLEASTEDSVFSQERDGTGVSIRRLSARDGTEVWKSAILEGSTQVEASVRVGNELVVAFGTSDDSGRRVIVLRALDLETGRPLWIREGPVASRPRILLSAGDAGHVILLSTSFEGPDLLIRIDPVSGREVWRRVVPRPVAVGEPATQLLVDALGASSVLWPGYGVAARLAKLDSEGSPVFHVGVEGAPRSIHRNADGHLLLPVAGARGTAVEKRSAASGRVLSRSTFAGPGESFLALSPSLAGGCVLHTFERATSTVVTRHLSDGGDVLAPHRVSMEGLSVLWREEGGGLRWNSRVLAVSSRGISLFDPETGAARAVLPDLDWSSQLTPEGDIVTRVASTGVSFAKRDGRTGAVLWQSQPESQSRFPVHWLVTSAGEVVSLQREETARLTFRRRSGTDGTVTARLEVGLDDDAGAAWETGSGFIVSTRNNSLFFLDPNPGTVRWHRSHFGAYGAAQLDTAGDLLVRRNLSLEKIDALTGRLVWIVPMWSGAHYPLPGGDILVVEAASITRLSGSTGAVLFRRPVDAEEPCSFFTGAVAGDGTYWASCPGRGQVVAIDSKTGGVRGRAVISPVPVGALQIVAAERDAYVFIPEGSSSSARLVRVSERMGVSPVTSPAPRCGELLYRVAEI